MSKSPTANDSLAQSLRAAISSGEHKLNELLPSEGVLAKRAGVSRWTVREALRSLRAEGLVRKVPGKGTYVSAPEMTTVRRRVGLVVDSYLPLEANAYIQELLKCIRSEVAEHGNSIKLYQEYVNLAKGDYSVLLNGEELEDLDSLVIIPSSQNAINYLEGLPASDKPVIVFGSQLKNKSLSQVWIDDFDGPRQAIEYLFQLGHRNIALVSKVTEPFRSSPDIIDHGYDPQAIYHHRILMRHDGFKEAYRRAGAEMSSDMVVDIKDDLSHTLQVIKSLIDGPCKPTAMFLADGKILLNVLHAIAHCGLRVPQDISLITYDDSWEARTYPTPITVIKQPLRAVAEHVVKALMDNSPVQRVEIPTEIILRGSCAKV